jgi:2-polyprenyl-6-methoxyphenol hydroxylase-like FAD-dependent oxidoreductase
MAGKSSTCDLLIIGGGIAGATLGRAMAQNGARVLIVERETAFRDRIRGEVLMPWGSVEAKALGIYDPLLARCAGEIWHEIFVAAGAFQPPRDYLTSTPNATCVLSFFHPDMQNALLAEAETAGAEIRRGASLQAVHPGEQPAADILVDGVTVRVTARLIVGADGRESKVAAQLKLERKQTPQELFTTGFQLSGDLPIEPALHFFLHGHSGRGGLVIRNQPGNYRAYLFHHKDAVSRRLAGERDYAAAFTHFREIGIPAAWLAAARPHGILATFDGAFRWIDSPVSGNCVLIGDAAGTTDPVWGNGLSHTLRDVRLLRDRLLADPDWTAAAASYAADHDDFYHRLKRAEQFSTTLSFSMGDAAEARRQRASRLMESDPELYPDLTGLGPEARCTDRTISTLLEL